MLSHWTMDGWDEQYLVVYWENYWVAGRGREGVFKYTIWYFRVSFLLSGISGYSSVFLVKSVILDINIICFFFEVLSQILSFFLIALWSSQNVLMVAAVLVFKDRSSKFIICISGLAFHVPFEAADSASLRLQREQLVAPVWILEWFLRDPGVVNTNWHTVGTPVNLLYKKLHLVIYWSQGKCWGIADRVKVSR